MFDYLYFHVIPAPRTIFADVPAARRPLRAVRERQRSAPWWNPVFDERRPAPFAALRDEFRALLRDAVAAQIARRARSAAS